MKGAFAHAGFPEISYGKWSSMLVAKGYKCVLLPLCKLWLVLCSSHFGVQGRPRRANGNARHAQEAQRQGATRTEGQGEASNATALAAVVCLSVPHLRHVAARLCAGSLCPSSPRA